MSDKEFSKGESVVFQGFTGAEDELPDNSELLEEGGVYTIEKVIPGDEVNEAVYVLQVENPEYDSAKRSTKANPQTKAIDVYGDEIAVHEAKPAAKAPAKTKATNAKAAPTKTAAKATGVSKKKAAVSAASKKKAATKAATKAAPKNAATKAAPAKSESKLKDKKEVDESTDSDLGDMILLTRDEEDSEILALVEDSEDICELVQEIAEESAATEYKLGGILYHVRVDHAYRKLDKAYEGRGGWQMYIEENLTISYRKVQYLMDIYAKFNKYGIDGAKAAELGWTKSSVIARVMDKKNAKKLVKLAKESTTEDLKDTIRETYTGGQEATPKVTRTTFKFRLLEDEGQLTRMVIEAAKDSLNLVDDNEAFAHIVSEWGAENLDLKKIKAKAKREAAKAEK